MALTEDDAGLVRELRELLSRHGADWIAEEIDAERSPVRGAQVDATLEAEALLVAMSRSLGVIPEMLLDASETLRALSQDADSVLLGVLLGDNEIPLAATDMEQLHLIAEDATIVAAPVMHLLWESADDE